MAAKFSFVSCKIFIVVVVIAVAMISLFSPAGAGEVVTIAAPQQENPQCNPAGGYVWPDCDTWCWNEGHPGGYVKGDVCCCNSGAAELAAES